MWPFDSKIISCEFSPGSLEWYQFYWDNCLVQKPYDNTTLVANKPFYDRVSETTRVPWQMIGALHSVESGCNLMCCLHNGEKIIGTGEKTKLVPAGRGPFSTWQDAAIDALIFDGIANRGNWTIPKILMFCEKYNGLGYLKYHSDTMSPYLWAGTDLYSRGKYSSDGKWNSLLVSKEQGIVPILKSLGGDING